MGGVRAGRGRDRRGAHAVIGEGLTLIELKVLRFELEERIRDLREKEERFGRVGRWNVRRELKEQRHRAETRLGEVERALARLEAE
jgi:hypothetical protein